MRYILKPIACDMKGLIRAITAFQNLRHNKRYQFDIVAAPVPLALSLIGKISD
jgi:hypothetical protein